MKSIKFNYIFAIFSLIMLMFIGCKKDFLEKKPNTNIVIPETLDDMMQLLDNVDVNSSTPGMPTMSADEYVITTSEEFSSLETNLERNCYVWKPDLYGGTLNIGDWNIPYQKAFYSNVVLEQYEKLSISNQVSIQGKYVKAWALFSRAYAFFNLVQVFAPTYNEPKAKTDLGIPLKLTSNINAITQRSSVAETYNQILEDLESSLPLFSDSFPTQNRNRPSKAAVYALLARIYLSMGKYDKALQASENSLSIYNKLIDYNSLDNASATPFSSYNDEMVLYSTQIPNYRITIVGYASAVINPKLIQMYEPNDLRKETFFRNENGQYFKKRDYGGASGGYYPFTGLAVDELYLIKAECLARGGNLQEAVNTLNDLLVKRYKTGSYVRFVSSSLEELISKILQEREKELVWRGLRWADVKRLNVAGANITLTRKIENTTYTLSPNDQKYVMPIPDDEIALSHIIQNQR